MRIIILGGTRFIGAAVTRKLVAKGHELMLFHRGQTPNEVDGVREVLGDREALIGYRDLFSKFEPDVLIDMFAYTEESARKVVETFEGMVRKVVMISSCDVYQAFGKLLGSESVPAEALPITETSRLRMNRYPYRDETKPDDWRYHYDKIPTEQVFLDSAMNVRIMRLPMVYGPGDYQRRMGSVIRRILDGRAVILLQEDLANWIATRGYVSDVADAIALACEHPEWQDAVYNVGESCPVSTIEWTSQIVASLGKQIPIVTAKKALMPELLRDETDFSQPLNISTSAIRAQLGFTEQTQPSEAIKLTAEWELQHPLPAPENIKQIYAAEDAVLQSLGNPLA